MTKSLTEKWKDGELKQGLYYARSTQGHKTISFHTNSTKHLFSPYSKYAMQTEEILAPVPSFDQFSQLVKKVELLEFDTDVLNSISEQQDEKLIAMDREMANMRKQIMQANKCIKHCSTHPCCEKYLKKWGVK